MTRLAPDEVEVWCIDCCCKLFNSSIYDHPKGVIRCPNPRKCEEEHETERQEILRSRLYR